MLALLLFCPLQPHAAESPEDIERSLQERKEKAKQAEEELVRLTGRERKLHTELAEAEDRIRALQQSVTEQEEALAEVMEEEQRVQDRYADLVLAKKLAMADLERLLAQLWPAYVENRANRGRKLPAWERSDRTFTWLSSIYEATREKLAQVREQQLRIQTALTRQQQLASQIRTRLAAVTRDKEQLQSERASFRTSLSRVREEITDREAQMTALMRSIENLNFKLEQSLTGEKPPFSRLQGLLDWPVDGPVEVDYAPGASPPQRGLGFALNPGETVEAVSWGKIVHNDLLRGFGRVIIVLHGEDYYSLYAFLSSSSVELGQDVEAGDPLGVAGYYPQVGGTGLYFELRFHQKAINPKVWLTPR